MNNQNPCTTLRASLREEYARFAHASSLSSLKIPADRATADRAVQGEIAFQFHVIQWTRVGRRDIDWTGRHHAHQEWPAQLNRFFQLHALASAWAETRESRYAEAACDYIADWLRANPTHPGWEQLATDNTLNLSIRLCSWWATLPLLLDAPVPDDTLLQDAADSTACQLAYLKNNMTLAGNWRVAQADAFLTCGLVLRSRPESADWRAFAVGILNDAFRRQVLPDGVHIERNPGYHSWMTAVFERCWHLGRAFPDLGLAMTPEVIARMHDYLLASCRPNGELNSLHDSQGACVARRKPDWDQARSNFRHAAGLPGTLPPTVQIFPHAGQALLRDSWNEEALYITFDATTWGGGHCHLSRNAIQLHAFGRSLLVDPGTLNYEVSDPLMAYGKSTRAHNTVSFNGWNQSYADPSPIRHVSGPGYECLSSLYQGGYWPGRLNWYFDQGNGTGLWAEHHRTLLWLRGRCLVVIDLLNRSAGTGEAEPYLHPFVEACWQFAPGTVRLDAEAGKAVTENKDANALVLFPLRPAGTNLTIHQGENDPPQGWVGPEPAPQVCLRTGPSEELSHNLATVIVPFKGLKPPAVSARAEAPGWTPKGYRPARIMITWPEGESDEVIWMPQLETMIGTAYGIKSDSSLVHVRRDSAGRLLQALPTDGTFCRADDQNP